MQFCDTPLWDLNRTWFTSDPDFTPCFHKTVLIYAPCLFLWLLTPFHWLSVSQSERRSTPWTLLSLTRVALTSALVAVSLAELVFRLVWLGQPGSSGGDTLSALLAPVSLCVTFLLSLLHALHDRRHGQVTSGVQTLFWFLLSLTSSLTLASVLRPYRGIDWSGADLTFSCIYLALVLTVSFLYCWADVPPQRIDLKEQYDNPSPILRASFLNKLLFAWFDPTIVKGWKSPLTLADLFDVPFKESCQGVKAKWQKSWQKQKQKKMAKSGTGQEATLSIFRTALSSFGPYYLQGSLLLLAVTLIQQLSPSLLSLLIGFVSSDEEQWKGYLYMLTLVGLNLLTTILNSQNFYILSMVGYRIRTAVSAAIYDKSLTLSADSRKARTVGETVNLMSIDTQRFMELIMSMNTMWSSPLIIGLSLYFLWGYLGPSCLAGLVVMVLLVPINILLSIIMKKYQFKIMKVKDRRIKLMNEILEGIQVMKLYAWGPSYTKRILDLRSDEVRLLKGMSYLMAMQTFMFTAAPFMVILASFATYVLSDESHILDAQKAFVSLTYFNLMRNPLMQLPLFLVNAIKSTVSLKRVNGYLNAAEAGHCNITRKSIGDNAIEVKKASFTWDSHKDPGIKSVDLVVKKGAMVAVVGQVGSGKSSLLSALVGDMDKVEGEVNVDGSVAFVPQEAWIQNATLRYNITFGKPFNKKVYEQVLDASAMRQDLNILDKGDLTEIGEKGVNLSGGQKQRVSMGRSIYSNRDIFMLDDPLSAVDAHVGKHIFGQVLSSQTGMLKKKTRIFVTNSVTYLSQMDFIVLMKDGVIAEQGTYKELMEGGNGFAEYVSQHAKKASDDEEDIDSNEWENEKADKSDKEERRRHMSATRSRKESRKVSRQHSAQKEGMSMKAGKKKEEDKSGLIVDEKVETQAVGKEVYWFYFKAVGLTMVAVVLVNAVLRQGFSVGANLWLSKWTDDPKAADPSVRNKYLGIYAALGLLASVFIALSSAVVAIGGLNASLNLHQQMLVNVLRAPMSFFHTNPKGRIVNRFAKDIDSIDFMVPNMFSFFLLTLSSVLGTVFVICYTNPLFIAVILPLAIVYYFVQRVYVATSRQLRRLESVTRSPIYSHFSESLSGVSTIRAYNMQESFVQDNEHQIDVNLGCSIPFTVSTRWLSVRLEMLGNVVILFAALFAVIGRDTVSPGIVGLSLNYASQITVALNLFIQVTSNIENNMVSVERVQEYKQDLEQEAHALMPEQDPDQSWPQHGVIKFDNYSTRYREGLEPVLKDLSFEIRSGEKVGIVGRTGAGKSSLTLALFRIIEPTRGSITIDGVNIFHMGLDFLRTRLTIIPQDPILFSGSLRSNLDPFDIYCDDEIWAALEHSHLKSFVSNLPSRLEHDISESGSNLSVGQRQLICLARALLRKTKVLILDEATAAIDLDTDDLIQTTIREEFSDCTVLTIAHRLKTIMDSNRIMVLSDGSIVEFDSPGELLSRQTSSFHGLAQEEGLIP